MNNARSEPPISPPLKPTQSSATPFHDEPLHFTEEQLENLALESNYLPTLKSGTEIDYFGLFIQIIDEFVKHLTKHLLMEDLRHKAFILSRGIQSLHHIFNHLLLYTKNIHLVVHHLQKAIFLYSEFNGQIKIDTNEYLNLSTNESIMFLYKKTIFALNPEKIRSVKLSPKEREMVDVLHSYTRLFDKLLVGELMAFSGEGLIKSDIDINNYRTIYPSLYSVIKTFKYVVVHAPVSRAHKLGLLRRIYNAHVFGVHNDDDDGTRDIVGMATASSVWRDMCDFIETRSGLSPLVMIQKLTEIFNGSLHTLGDTKLCWRNILKNGEICDTFAAAAAAGRINPLGSVLCPPPSPSPSIAPTRRPLLRNR
jgi:hypothetical protein